MEISMIEHFFIEVMILICIADSNLYKNRVLYLHNWM